MEMAANGLFHAGPFRLIRISRLSKMF